MQHHYTLFVVGLLWPTGTLIYNTHHQDHTSKAATYLESEVVGLGLTVQSFLNNKSRLSNYSRLIKLQGY